MVWGLLCPLLHSFASALMAAPPNELDRYNVVWDTPSQNASGSMPIGNGEVGLNVWVEENGDLRFYISRTDAWSEACRLLKLGRIRLSLSPNPFAKGTAFRQELNLRDGCIEIAAGPAGEATKLKVFVDADAPVVHVIGECERAQKVKATLETWRTERKLLQGDELSSSWTMQRAPAEIEVWEAGDVVADQPSDAVTWYHRNEHSVVPLTLKHQGIDAFANLVADPLLNRTFGGRLAARGFKRHGGRTLESDGPVRHFTLQITTHSAQTSTAESWQKQLRAIAARFSDSAFRAGTTAAWWHEFWDRSWVFVEGDTEGPGTNEDRGRSPITQAYILQRWMAACAGRGNYPIKFNGSIFTVDPEFSGGPKLDADWRKWGDCYWWQNTRLPPYAAIASGDYDQCRALFRLYREVLPICRARTKSYYDADGVYFPETMTIFGTYANCDYGWKRQGRKANEVLCPWWCYAWQQGLELVMLMQDYYDHTQDRRFLRDHLLPMAADVLRYYDTRFARDQAGKLVISPTQAVETYWHSVTNDTPSVAGLNAVLNRLLALPRGQVPAHDRKLWVNLKEATPPVPVRREGDRSFVLPAEHFDPKRSNVENPELYAVWPFRLFGVGRPNLSTGTETFQRRVEKGMKGWAYDGQCAAILGLTEEARRQILYKVGNSNPNHRFPAMWGPNFDWLPDQDHGSNIMLTLQHMLLATDGEKLILLPAWPRDWNVSFKLHAPRQTVIEVKLMNGEIAELKVTPGSRRKDVVAPSVLGRN